MNAAGITEEELMNILVGTEGGEYDGVIWHASFIDVDGTDVWVGGSDTLGAQIDVAELAKQINQHLKEEA